MITLRRNALLVVALLAFVVPRVFASGTESKSLIGKSYRSARGALIKNGWTPISLKSVYLMGWEREIQGKYPELESCAVDRPVCLFSFIKRRECLRVITLGERVESFAVSAVQSSRCN